MDCSEFGKMKKMFQGKDGSSSKGKTIVEVKIITTNVNVVDVNVDTRSIIIKDQVFQKRKPQKRKSIVDWEKEENLKKTMVDIIQQLQKSQAISEGSSTPIKGWNTMWPRMPDTTPFMKPQKPQEYIISQSKLILIKEIFQDISKKMLQTNCALNLGQLLKMEPKLKKYLQQKMKLDKPNIVTKIVTKKTTSSIIPKVATTTVIINNHMADIQVQIGKNIVDDALLDGGSRVNIIIKQFGLKLGLPKPKQAPCNLRMVDKTTTKLVGLICDLKYMFITYPMLLCLLYCRIV